MSTTEKKNQVPTIGQLLSHFFHCDKPDVHAERLMRCWACVLSNLDHDMGNHLGLADIQLISEFMLDYRTMADAYYVSAPDAVR